LKFLQAYECTEGQGYYFSKPVEPNECQALISLGKPHRAWQLSSPTLHAIK
jgi:EAL domain-containing protein (putative c-di-GMP-specific phosphodiesterase class I)